MTNKDPAPNVSVVTLRNPTLPEDVNATGLVALHCPWVSAISMTSPFPFLFLSFHLSLSLSFASQEPNSSPCLRVHNSTIIFSSKIIFSNTNMPLESHPLYQAADQLISSKHSALLNRNSGKYNSILLLNTGIKELLTWEVEEA